MRLARPDGVCRIEQEKGPFVKSKPEHKPSAKPQPVPESASAFGAALGEMWKGLGSLSMAPQTLAELQSQYLKDATEAWNQALGAGSAGSAMPLRDRRFSAAPWASNAASAYTAQMYLLNARTLTQMAEAVQGDAKTKARIRFAVQQWVDAASPSNFLATNPEAVQKAIDTQGQSLAQGIQQMLADVKKGHVSQTDESVFEVGRNVATSAGSVVYENAFFQLIEYAPLTKQVHMRPMLFVPPCINKYYILDLQPENSLIRHTVAQGHRVFVVSWRNPDESMKASTWDDYIEQAAIRAIDVVQRISGQPTINTLGFCVGGTILATALAVLAARGEHPAHSVTLLTTLLDFEDTGVLDVFIDEAMVQLREATLGATAPGGPQLLKGQELATTFSFLRPNDLVWNYVVANYLKGEAPPAFDLLYWNGDSTNLPGPMYCWYLRHMYLRNELKQPGRLTVCGQKLDLGAIRAPVYLYGSREDHIVPWLAAYRSVTLLRGDASGAVASKGLRGKGGGKGVRFVLGASGHIAGVINPPAAKKRSHWINDSLPATADAWLAGATEVPGSWWSDWDRWLAPHGGAMQSTPKTPGGRGFKAIEPAPGRYVKAKA
jgi:polyhydroxyalkanoate synthase subunit PhaC